MEFKEADQVCISIGFNGNLVQSRYSQGNDKLRVIYIQADI